MKVLVSDTSVLIDLRRRGNIYRKKLIEVALPLDAINTASAREKSIRHGHPSTLHLWWARRPLAAARAVLFAQMVDDPSDCPEEFPTEADQKQERERLFRLIEELVRWENTTNEELLEQARGRSAGAGAAPAPTMPGIRAPPSCSTRTGCRPSTIPSRAAGPCRWKRSAWGWRPMPATSTRWRCSSTRR